MPRELHRRAVVWGALGTGTALAGCGQSDPTEDPGGADNGGDPGGPPADETTLTFPTNESNPADVQWNKYFLQGSGAGDWFMYDPLMIQGPYPRNVDASTYPDRLPAIATEATTEGSMLTISLDEERTWHDGDPILADDVAMQFEIENYLGSRTADVWKSLETPDDRTVRFELASENTDIAMPQLVPQLLKTKRGTRYADFLERFRDATTDEAITSIQQELVQARFDNPVGTGPFALEEATSNRFVLRTHDGHPAADRTNVDRVELQPEPNNQKRRTGLAAGNFDGLLAGAIPKSQEADLPDSIERFAYNNSLGTSFLYNHDRMFSDRRVRMAITYVTNRWRNSHNAFDYTDVLRYPCGLPNAERKRWIGEDPEGFLQYGYESSKTEAATRLLEEAGYSLEDGEWYTPDGDRFTIEIISGSGGAWTLFNRTTSQILSDFGIDAIARVMEGAAFGERVSSGDFDMSVNNWGARGGGRHPYNFFSQEFSEANNQRDNVDPTAIEVPYPVGDPEGSLETVDVTAKISQLANATDDETEGSLVQELAWIYNQFLPRYPMNNSVIRAYMSREGWSFPAVDSKFSVHNPVSTMLRKGQLRAE